MTRYTFSFFACCFIACKALAVLPDETSSGGGAEDARQTKLMASAARDDRGAQVSSSLSSISPQQASMIEDGNYIISCKTKNKGTRYAQIKWCHHGADENNPSFYSYELIPGEQKQMWSIRNNKGYYEIFAYAPKWNVGVYWHVYTNAKPSGIALPAALYQGRSETQEQQWSINSTDEGAYTFSLKTNYGETAYLEAYPRLRAIRMQKQKTGSKAQDQKWYLERIE